jgi:hypothetical protein
MEGDVDCAGPKTRPSSLPAIRARFRSHGWNFETSVEFWPLRKGPELHPCGLVPSVWLLATEPEEVLRHLAHLDLLGTFGDPITTMVPVDVLKRHVP